MRKTCKRHKVKATTRLCLDGKRRKVKSYYRGK